VAWKGVIGIQMVNEAQWNPPGVYIFYENALPKIGAIDPTPPVYISDGWDLGRALKYARSKNSVKGKVSNPVTSAHTCTTRSLKRHFSRTAGALSLKSPWSWASWVG
jgi:hypothetical protein